MTDSSRGSRYTHTLRKLPSSEPKMPAKTIRTGSAIGTRQLVEQDPRRHGGVERLGARAHRDAHAAVRPLGPRGAHAVALAPQDQRHARRPVGASRGRAVLDREPDGVA